MPALPPSGLRPSSAGAAAALPAPTALVMQLLPSPCGSAAMFFFTRERVVANKSQTDNELQKHLNLVRDLWWPKTRQEREPDRDHSAAVGGGRRGRFPCQLPPPAHTTARGMAPGISRHTVASNITSKLSFRLPECHVYVSDHLCNIISIAQ